LESFVSHGFFNSRGDTVRQGTDKLEHIVDFLRDNLSTYAHSALAFVSDAHTIAQEAIVSQSSHISRPDDALRTLLALDSLYESMTLNHVARRASATQGVALLSLYSKGFSKPRIYSTSQEPEGSLPGSTLDKSQTVEFLVDQLKLLIRREETPGHLPVCWGVLTAALGLSLERSQFLHLFLCARGVLSAAVRMNICGPYAAQQLLLHAVRPIVDAETSRCAGLRTGVSRPLSTMDAVCFDEEMMINSGPAMTWPLGEILAARHDLQHSRVFNS
jgi:urease accessory protein